MGGNIIPRDDGLMNGTTETVQMNSLPVRYNVDYTPKPYDVRPLVILHVGKILELYS